jgi:hypothetical protein
MADELDEQSRKDARMFLLLPVYIVLFVAAITLVRHFFFYREAIW